MLVVVLSFPCDGQNIRTSEQVLSWMPVKRLCGRLESAEKSRLLAVPTTKLNLDEAKWRKQCCKGLKLVDSRITGTEGDFDFGLLPSGRYWLSVEFEKKETALAIDLDVHHEWEGSCGGQGVVIDGKSLSWIAGTATM